MADAADLKSADGFLLYGFESRLRHFRSKSKGTLINKSEMSLSLIVADLWYNSQLVG